MMPNQIALANSRDALSGQPIAYRYRDYLPISRLWSAWKFSTFSPAKVQDREVESLQSAADFLAMQERAERAEMELAAERALRKQWQERLDSPHTDAWFESVRLEAAQQIGRWGGDSYDPGENSRRLVLLISYLAAKALDAAAHDNADKAKHYTINTGAALLNWFRAMVGDFSRRHANRAGAMPLDARRSTTSMAQTDAVMG